MGIGPHRHTQMSHSRIAESSAGPSGNALIDTPGSHVSPVSWLSLIPVHTDTEFTATPSLLFSQMNTNT